LLICFSFGFSLCLGLFGFGGFFIGFGFFSVRRFGIGFSLSYFSLGFFSFFL
jgi:hypothetical protein